MSLKFGYIALSFFMSCVILFGGLHIINKTFKQANQRKKKKVFLIVGLLLWHLYIFIIGNSGILQDYSLPPRVLIFLIFPAFLFSGIFLFKNRNNTWVHNIPQHWLVFYQIFRIAIETLFVCSVAKGFLPSIVTIQGYNYDMIFAFTAPIIGFILYKQWKFSKIISLVWNYLGLAVIASILFLFTTTIYFPQFYGSQIELMSKEFGLYPYPLVPAFLMPSAVFVHILSIINLKRNLN